MEITRTLPVPSTLESYLDRLNDSSRPDISSRIISDATCNPISTLKLADPKLSFEWQLLHRPNSVLVVASIMSDTSKKIHTVVCGGVYHYGAAAELPNFPTGGIDPNESVEEAALREMSEEIPVLERDWIKRVSYLGNGEHNYNSVGSSSEQLYPVHIEAQLPSGMTIDQLNGHIGGVEAQGERIRSQVEVLCPELESKLCGIADKYALLKVLSVIKH